MKVFCFFLLSICDTNLYVFSVVMNHQNLQGRQQRENMAKNIVRLQWTQTYCLDPLFFLNMQWNTSETSLTTKSDTENK